MTGVPWRRVALVFAAVALAVSGVFVAFRADGFDAVDATVPRATRWFVDDQINALVLVDGFAGKLLAKVPLESNSNQFEVVQGPSGASVLDRSGAATSQTIDTAALRVGSAQSLELVSSPDTIVGLGQSGVVAVQPGVDTGVLLPPEGEPLPFDVGDIGRDEATRVSSDGAVWTIADGSFARITTTGREVLATGLGTARFSLAGNTPLLLDADRQRVRFGDGDWVALPGGVPISEIVVQQPGPPASCGWVGGNDRLWCIGADRVEERVDIDGLDIDGSDLLAIAGDAGVVVRPGSSEIVPIDWRAGETLDTLDADVDPDDSGPGPTPDAPSGADFSVASTVDLVWVEDVTGEFVWAINPWGVSVIRKTDQAPLIGDTGDVIEGEDEPAADGGTGSGTEGFEDEEERLPDEDGIDEAPQAFDDQVTARFGIAVPIAVTANDFDPDGDAIAVVAVDVGDDSDRRLVTIQSASTVLYSPEAGTVGTDTFDYTITDAAGHEDTATVTVQVLPADAPNTAPVGRPDSSETRINTPVIVDVLANDIDPERDALQIGSFTAGDRRGTVTETEGPNGQPALEFTPLENVSGTARFTYRPVDAFGAFGDPVAVTVTIAPQSAGNRPPVARPDAVRVRLDRPERVKVLANDTDPDGDTMTPRITSAIPDGFSVEREGSTFVVTARAGAARLGSFDYTVSDGQGGEDVGQVLVSVIDTSEPNAPPLANADTETAVVGVTKLIDVLDNDRDPDDDQLTILSVSQPTDGSAIGTLRIVGGEVEYVADRLPADDAVFDRFSYRITDGWDNVATGDVTVRVLPEPVDLPPFARNDTATTVVDKPVVVDVLRNDGDPSGGAIVLQPGVSCAAGGEAEAVDGGRVRFAPPLGRDGEFRCVYTISNSQGLRATGELSISVVPAAIENKPPVVPDKAERVEFGETRVINLLVGVVDPDSTPGDPAMEVVDWDRPAGINATLDGSTLTYVAPDMVDVVSIVYQVRDADGGVGLGHLTIEVVQPAPVAPEAQNDTGSVVNDAQGTVVEVDVLANDVDPDRKPADLPLRITRADVVGGGGVATYVDDTVVVTVAERYFGRIRVVYEVIDAQGLTDTAEVAIDSIKPANRAPVAGDDSGEVTNGGTVTIPIALNDSDPDADVLTYDIVSGSSSALGEARIQDGNTLLFDAAPGASGTAIVVYSASDGTLTDNAVVRISVLACAAALPEAPDVDVFTGYQQPVTVDLTQYARNGEIVDVGAPHGAPVAVYTPPAGFNDNVTLNYVVRNACGIDAVGRVVIDVNQDPVAASVVEDMGRRSTLSVPVETLASDPNGEALVIERLDGAPAWVTLSADGKTITAVPAGASGSVTFTAHIVDPGGLTADSAVTINLVNLAPVPNADQYRADNGPIAMDVLANDTDPDGDAIGLQSVPATVTFTNGVTVALLVSNDVIQVDPGAGVGTATFDYDIVDAQGLPSVQSARVTITVNTPPTAPPVDVTMQAGTVQSATVPATDPDGGPLVITIESDPTPLTITVNGLDLQITAPVEAANNQYALIYRVTDPAGASTQGTLNITVLPPG
jgi:hypothetical protein